MQKGFTKERTNMVKGVAIIFMLLYHLFQNQSMVLSLKVNYFPFDLKSFLTLTGFGNICVATFVFLTAYGISRGLYAQGEITAKEIYRQAMKRFFTLMLNFAILYISVNVLWWKYFDYQTLYGEFPQGLLHAVTDGLGLSMFTGTPTLNATWWYMEVAYILIFLVPVLVWVTRKVGYPVLVLAVLVPAVIDFNFDVERYLFTAVMGVLAAQEGWLDKLVNVKGHPALRWLAGIAGLLLSILVRQNSAVQQSYLYYVDGVIVLVMVYLGGVLFASIPFINKVLEFIGKHSMNIYLVHTFFYMMLWQSYIYRFRYAPFILGALLLVTLLYSIVLEVVKKGAVMLYKKVRER